MPDHHLRVSRHARVGEGFRWFAIDVLGFDEAFFGVLQQLGAAIAIVQRGCSPT